jgi:pimeloyl-ACP methyl ester carboxylesterase
MGLGTMKYVWQRQTKDFGHIHGDQYTSLVFDNRGVGESDQPLAKYTTTELAKDVVELVNSLGWKGKRELHVVGVSLGGMIAQQVVRCSSSLYAMSSCVLCRVAVQWPFLEAGTN